MSAANRTAMDGAEARGASQHHHHVHAGIDFGCHLAGCGTPNSASISGKITASAPQSRNTSKYTSGRVVASARSVSCQTRSGTSDVNLAAATIRFISCARLIGDAKAEVGKSRREARHAQNAHRVFHERFGNVAQQPRLDIGAAAVGIDDASPGGDCFIGDSFGHGVDREVAALRSSSSLTSGENSRGEAAVAGPGLALEPRQRVLLARLRMQEHGKITADRQITLLLELLGQGADHHPVALAHGQAEQPVPDGAAD